MSLLSALLFWMVAAAGHVVLWVAIVNRTHAYGWHRKLVDLLTFTCAVMLVAGLWPVTQFALAADYPSALPRMAPAVAEGNGWACVVLAVVSAVHNLWRWLHPERRGGVARRRQRPLDDRGTEPNALLADGVPRLLGRLPGNQVVAPMLVELELSVPNLPPRFDGLRIVHLSDLHMSGRIRQPYFDLVVDAVNELQADVVAITGDIVERNECLDWIDQTLARLTASQARLFVLGNHDLQSDPPQIRSRLTQAGFLDVGGTVATIDLAGGQCLVEGNELPWFPPPSDLAGHTPLPRDPDQLRLAMLHTPDHFRWAQRRGFHVALAGHNHGGQIRFPVLGAVVAPSKHGTRYPAGVYRTAGTVMHVSQGTSSLAPLRWNCPPEVALLTLRQG